MSESTKSINLPPKDVMARWTFPIVPDLMAASGEEDEGYVHCRKSIYKAGGGIKLEKGSVLEESVVVGRGCVIGEGSVVSKSCIGENVKIGREVLNCPVSRLSLRFTVAICPNC